MSDAEPRPMPREIRTERLVLCAVTPDDAPDQSAAVNASLAELRPWMPWAQAPQSVEAARENLVEAAAAFDAGTELAWFLRDAQTGTLLGRVGMHRLDWSLPKGEIGYWMVTEHTGQGYMREAVRAVVDAALAVGMVRVEIRCDDLNARSAAIPEALGFTLDGVLHHDDRAADDPSRLRSTRIYSLVP